MHKKCETEDIIYEHPCRGRRDLDALLLDLESASIAYCDAPMDYMRRKHADAFRALATPENVLRLIEVIRWQRRFRVARGKFPEIPGNSGQTGGE